MTNFNFIKDFIDKNYDYKGIEHLQKSYDTILEFEEWMDGSPNMTSNYRLALESAINYTFTEVEDIQNIGSKLKQIKEQKLVRDGEWKIVKQFEFLNDEYKYFSHPNEISQIFNNRNSKIKFLSEMHKLLVSITNINAIFDFELYNLQTINNEVLNETEYDEQLTGDSYIRFSELITDNETYTNDKLFEIFIADEVMEEHMSDEEPLIGGPNDGGIDLFTYDESDQTLNLTQIKLHSKYSKSNLRTDFDKMISTISKFNNNDYFDLNKSLISKISSLFLKVGDQKIELNLFLVCASKNSILKKDVEAIEKIMENRINKEIKNNPNKLYIKSVTVNFIDKDKIEERYYIRNVDAGLSNQKLKLTETKSFFSIFKSDEKNVHLASITGESLRELYLAQEQKGPRYISKLFDRNVRGYIREKTIDSNIAKTLKEKPDDFSMLNNGLTIVCDRVNKSGSELHFDSMYIINGGQTTTLIGDSKGSLSGVNVVIKIIEFSERDIMDEKVLDISIASNSQKPIKNEDLISNNRVLQELVTKLEKNKKNIYILSKRNLKSSTKLKKKAKNTAGVFIDVKELLQVYNAFFKLDPKTSRSTPKKILQWDTNDINKAFGELMPSEEDIKNSNSFLGDLLQIWSLIKENRSKYQNMDYSSDSDANDIEINKNASYYWLTAIAFMYFYKKFEKENNFISLKGKATGENSFMEFIFANYKYKTMQKSFINSEYLSEVNSLFEIFSDIVSSQFSEQKDWSKLFKGNEVCEKLLIKIFDQLQSKLKGEKLREIYNKVFIN